MLHMTTSDVDRETTRPTVAWWPLLGLAAALVALLIAFSGRYGYHRDELYFLLTGDHLAWGYPDQPPLIPALARLIDGIAPNSLVALRIPAALGAGGVVLLTGLIARELGGSRGAQIIAAGSMACSGILFSTGHLFGTTVIDLLAWTAVTVLTAKLLRGSDPRWWLALGTVLGVALMNKSLIVALVAALLIAVLLVGPREALRTKWLPVGVLIAVVIVLPNLLWQATNGWPQLQLSAAIAGGSSGTSESRWLLLPYQMVLISPVLAPIWIIGLVRLLRARRNAAELLPFRAFAVAYLLLAVVFLVTGGKPYYLTGLYPVLLSAGAPTVLHWLRGLSRAARAVTVTLAVGLTVLINAVLLLPVLPAGVMAGTPIVDINYDGGETVGWPEFTATVAGVVDSLSPDERANLVLLTENYGEAGAIGRYGAEYGLPDAFSGHNALYAWGPPSDADGRLTVAVGFPESVLRQWFGAVQRAAVIDNGIDLDNDEQGAVVWICRDRQLPWAEIWPSLRRYG